MTDYIFAPFSPRSGPVSLSYRVRLGWWKPLDVPHALAQSHGLCRESMVPDRR